MCGKGNVHTCPRASGCKKEATCEWAELRRGRQGTKGRATKLKRAQQYMQERAAEYSRWGQSIKAEAK